MARFNMLELTGHRVVVTGVDSQGNQGKTILDGTEWAGLKRHDLAHQAEAEYDAAVQEFFAPMVEAQEKFDAIFKGENEEDPIESIVLHEAVEATPGQAEVKVRLSKDSQILRLIETNEFDRLLWVTESNLEILKTGAVAVQPMLDEDDAAVFTGNTDADQA